MKCPLFDIDPINPTTCGFCSAYCIYRQKSETITTTNTLLDYYLRTICK